MSQMTGRDMVGGRRAGRNCGSGIVTAPVSPATAGQAEIYFHFPRLASLTLGTSSTVLPSARSTLLSTYNEVYITY